MKSWFGPRWVAAGLALAGLAACGGGDDEILLGEREALGRAATEDATVENQSLPISLRTAQANASWTHPGGSATHTIPHPSFASSPALAWSSPIGAGDGRRQRINAQPVVVDGRVFTVDSEGVVAATSTSGANLWTRDLTPSTESRGQGGSHGLSFGGGQLYVNTAFGEVVALDPASGTEIWSQAIESQAGGSTTYFDGRLYVASRDSVGWTLDAETGRIDWQINGTPSGSGYLGGAGPAVTSDLAIFPFSSGELVATFRRGGVQRWNATVLGARDGVAYSQISDLSADPVVDGDRVYVANAAGRLVALDLNTGSRLWTAREGAARPPAVAGGSVFILNDQNRLMRLDASDGETIWSVNLPLFVEENENRQETIFAHNGPVLAGGRLWLASSDGQLRGFNPESGALLTSVGIPGGAATAPVLAGGVMYIVSKNGQLLAFR
ncbi:MAG: PQQ-binding-like beta-propeller repeat protein [Pseudomonadota bacterium]